VSRRQQQLNKNGGARTLEATTMVGVEQPCEMSDKGIIGERCLSWANDPSNHLYVHMKCIGSAPKSVVTMEGTAGQSLISFISLLSARQSTRTKQRRQVIEKLCQL
jgi:hypothetical protein